MNYVNHNQIPRVIAITLTFFVSVFATLGVSAQTISATEIENDPVITITARVIGCGDGVVQTGLGEQCDGVDLNTQTCGSLGFTGGSLSCRPACIFETSVCTNNPIVNNTGSSGGGRKKTMSDIFNDDIPETNVVFTGQGEPGSTFFVTTPDGYFTSVEVDARGTFSATVSEPESGDYDFTFYTLSTNGLFGPHIFSTPIQEYATTYINNIFISYDIEEEILEISIIDPPIPIIPQSKESIIQNPPVDNSEPIHGDVYAEFLDVLSQNENLSPDELRELIKVFSEQNGYTAEVPGYSDNGWQIAQRWLSQNTHGLSEWYPNVYISFMVPYWNIVYDLTSWFNEHNAPFLMYTFFL